jgi:hypothetical protein
VKNEQLFSKKLKLCFGIFFKKNANLHFLQRVGESLGESLDGSYYVFLNFTSDISDIVDVLKIQK